VDPKEKNFTSYFTSKCPALNIQLRRERTRVARRLDEVDSGFSQPLFKHFLRGVLGRLSLIGQISLIFRNAS
jgi:hypothetical protein